MAKGTKIARVFTISLVLLILTAALPFYALAQEYPVAGLTLELIYFRQSPTAATTPRVTGCETIPRNTDVTVLCESENFYLLQYKGYYGFARKQDIRLMNNTPATAASAPAPAHERSMYAMEYSGVTLEKVYFRINPAPASNPRVIGCESIPGGKNVSVLGESGSFYWISYNGYYGYARKQDVRVYAPAAPTPPPAVVPHSAVLTSSQSEKWAAVPSKLRKAKASNPDTVGWIYVPGTVNIDYPIMYDQNLYYNDHTPARKSSSAGSIYMYYNAIFNINAIGGHNMRSSKTRFHELHHVQARLCGRRACEYCGASVTGINASNTVFNITLGNYTAWQLFAMYETKANETPKLFKYNVLYPVLDGDDFKTWINYQLSRSQVNFGVNVEKGPVVVLVTCGDNYDSSTAQSRLYMFLVPVE